MKLFQGVSSLSELHLAGNVYDLLDDVTGSVSFCLVPESDESSEDVSEDSYGDDGEKESDKISICFCAVWTHSCSFVCFIAAFAAC